MGKNTMKTRVASISLIVVMLLGSFAGCAKPKQEDTSSEKSQPAVTAEQASTAGDTANTNLMSWEVDKDKPVTLGVYFDGVWNFDKNYGEDFTTKKAIEDTGVTMKFSYASDWTESTINVMIASNEFPDIMAIMPGRPAARKMVESGLLWSYDDLKNEAGIDVIKNLNQNQRLHQRCMYDTEKIYMIPTGGVPDSKMNDTFNIKSLTGTVINQSIYEQLGSPAIQNGEDFINLLKLVKEKYPDMYPAIGNRNAGTNDWGETQQFVALRSFVGLNNPKSYLEDGKPYLFHFQTSAYLDLLKYLNRMVNEKLLSPTDFTDQSEQLQAHISNGKTFSILSEDADNIDGWNSALDKVKNGQKYTMVENVSLDPSKYKNVPAGAVGLGWLGLAIPKATKEYKRALAYVDYIMSEDFQKMNIFGQEGTHYSIVDGYPKLNKEIADKLYGGMELLADEEASKLGLNHVFMLRDAYWAMVDRYQRASDLAKSAFKIANANFVDITDLEVTKTAYPENSEEVKVFAAVKDYFSNEIVKIAMGKPENVESGYQAMISKMMDMGLQKLIDFQTASMKQAKEKIAKYNN